MPRKVIRLLIPAISSLREVAADVQKEEFSHTTPKSKSGEVTDYDGVEALESKLSGLKDLVEEK